MSDYFDHRLKRTLESDADRIGHGVSNVRRIELITGTGRRRRWSSDDKARIVTESLGPGANVSEVARRNGLSPQQLFAWRRTAHALLQEGADATPADRTDDVPARGSGGRIGKCGCPAAVGRQRWPRLLGQFFRLDKWIVCRG